MDNQTANTINLFRLDKAKQFTAWRKFKKSFPYHEGQVVAKDHFSNSRFFSAACGRRFGKTTFGQHEALEEAVIRGGNVWWISPTFPMAMDCWNTLVKYSANFGGTVSRGELTITFPRNGSIRVRSGNDPDSLRGSGLDLIIIDEAAFQHEEVWEVVRPSLSDKVGKALLLSTPKGRNWFWRLWSKDEDGWLSLQLPSTSNPIMTEQELDSAKKDLPEKKFREEYLAEFSEDYGTVFRNIDACKVDVVPSNLDEVVFGIDWGRYNDFTVVTVFSKNPVGAVESIAWQDLSFPVQREKIVSLYEQWKPTIILAEENGMGISPIEELQVLGLPVVPFNTNGTSKQYIIDQLSIALEKQEMFIPNDKKLIHELKAFEMERTGSGNYKYSAPSGEHDDRVMSLAFALHASRYSRLQIF